MAKTLDTFQRELRSFATTGMPTAARTAVEKAGGLAARRMEGRYRAAGYSQMRFRGKQGKAIPIRVVASVQDRKGGAVALVRPAKQSAGPARIIESGSYKKPEGWDIVPYQPGRRAVRNAERRGRPLSVKRALRTPEGPRARVHHPHLAARPVWRGAAPALTVETSRLYSVALGAAMARTFR